MQGNIWRHSEFGAYFLPVGPLAELLFSIVPTIDLNSLKIFVENGKEIVY
jgi:hypothetical protein